MSVGRYTIGESGKSRNCAIIYVHRFCFCWLFVCFYPRINVLYPNAQENSRKFDCVIYQWVILQNLKEECHSSAPTL